MQTSCATTADLNIAFIRVYACIYTFFAYCALLRETLT